MLVSGVGVCVGADADVIFGVRVIVGIDVLGSVRFLVSMTSVVV